MERDAVGPGVDRGHDLARRGEPGRQDRRHHEGGLVVGERPEPGLVGQALAQQPRAPLPVDRGQRQLVDPVAADNEQREPRRPPCELADHLEGQLVRPLQVVEPDERRRVDPVDDQVGDLVHQQLT